MRTVACVLVWSILLGFGCYLFGAYVQSNADQVKIDQGKERERKLAKRKDAEALAAGLRVERVQAQTDTSFQRLQADYATDQLNNPGIGCVLDPVSLRRWNEANAQSDGGGGPGEPAGEVSVTPEGAAGGERGE